MMRRDHGAFMPMNSFGMFSSVETNTSYRADLMRSVAASYALARYELLTDMQVLEEFTGTGFYRPRLEHEYVDKLASTDGLEALAAVLIKWCEKTPTPTAATETELAKTSG